MSNPETAVTVIEQIPDAVVEWNLDNWPVERFNRLVPTQTLGMATDLIRPIVQVVQLDIETDTYASRDLKEGHRAPNARGLSLLADALGADFVDEVRLDDGSDPNRAYVRVYAEMVDPTGRKRRAPGSRDFRLDSQPMTDAQRNRAKGYVHEHAATRARHRALRALASIPQSYPIADLHKPFAVVRYVLNMQHPEVRSRVLDAMIPTAAALFGAEPAKQLAAGDTVTMAEVPDDPPINVMPAEAPRQLPGEKLAAATVSSDDPPWVTGAADGSAGNAQADAVDIVEAIREAAAVSKLKGQLTDPQKAQIGPLLAPLNGTGAFGLVVREAFGPEAVREPTAAQAQAIIIVASKFESPELFVAAWAATADAIRQAAA